MILFSLMLSFENETTETPSPNCRWISQKVASFDLVFSRCSELDWVSCGTVVMEVISYFVPIGLFLDGLVSFFPAFFPIATWLRIRFLVVCDSLLNF